MISLILSSFIRGSQFPIAKEVALEVVDEHFNPLTRHPRVEGADHPPEEVQIEAEFALLRAVS